MWSVVFPTTDLKALESWVDSVPPEQIVEIQWFSDPSWRGLPAQCMKMYVKLRRARRTWYLWCFYVDEFYYMSERLAAHKYTAGEQLVTELLIRRDGAFFELLHMGGSVGNPSREPPETCLSTLTIMTPEETFAPGSAVALDLAADYRMQQESRSLQFSPLPKQ